MNLDDLLALMKRNDKNASKDSVDGTPLLLSQITEETQSQLRLADSQYTGVIEADNSNNSIDTDVLLSKENLLCGWSDGIREVQGLAYLAAARTIILAKSTFLSSALLYLAKQAAEEKCGEHIKDCKINGIVPSNIVIDAAMVSSLVSAAITPILGSLIDYTHHRKNIGIFLSVVALLSTISQIWTRKETWFIMTILEVILMICFNSQVLVTFAYFPEIAIIVPEKEKMNTYVSMIMCIGFAACIILNSVCVTLAKGLELDDIQTSQISQIVAAVLLLICFVFGWSLTPSVGPKRELEAGQNLYLQGFWQLRKTFLFIGTNHSHLFFFFGAVSLYTTGERKRKTHYIIRFLHTSNSLIIFSLNIYLFTLITTIKKYSNTCLAWNIHNFYISRIRWNFI